MASLGLNELTSENNVIVRAQATILYDEFENYTFLELLPHLPLVNELITYSNSTKNEPKHDWLIGFYAVFRHREGT